MNKPFVPHITEKAFSFVAEDKKVVSRYTFRVPRTVTKEIVRAQIEKQYKVHVEAVTIINIPGKVRRFRGILGRTQAQKKAIVRLHKGERIPDYSPETATSDPSKNE